MLSSTDSEISNKEGARDQPTDGTLLVTVELVGITDQDLVDQVLAEVEEVGRDLVMEAQAREVGQDLVMGVQVREVDLLMTRPRPSSLTMRTEMIMAGEGAVLVVVGEAEERWETFYLDCQAWENLDLKQGDKDTLSRVP